MNTTERLDKLVVMLAQQPADPFLLYGVAMEHKKLEQHDAALAYLDKTLAADPNYCYAYYQKGLIKESLGDIDGAKVAYREGIEAATRSGDGHARSELEAALDMAE